MVSLFGVGSNVHGQIGVNSKSEDVSSPTLINLPKFSSMRIVGGSNHTIISDGHRILTCGDNQQGQLGRDSISTSEFYEIYNIPDLDEEKTADIIDISAGWDFSMVIAKYNCSSYLLGFGSNRYGVLGVSPSRMPYSNIPIPVHYSVIQNPYKVACGVRHVLVACRDDSGKSAIYSWGETRHGKLGREESFFQTFISCVPQRLDIDELKHGNVVSITVGHHHSAILTASGVVYIFGRNKFGIFTNDNINTSKIDLNSLISNKFETNWSSIHSCWNTLYVLCHHSGGSFLIGWGRNNYQQLSQSTQQVIPSPVIVMNEINGIKQIECGSEHVLILMTDGSLKAYGWNEHSNCNIDLIGKFVGIGCGYAGSFVVVE